MPGRRRERKRPREEISSKIPRSHCQVETPKSSSSESLSFLSTDSEEDASPTGGDIWRPGQDEIPSDHELTFHAEAYDLYQSVQLDSSCYSFDFIPDQLGAVRTDLPATLYFAAGTVTDASDRDSRIHVVKWSKLEGVVGKDDMSENEFEDPEFASRFFSHSGDVMALRVCPQLPRLLMAWSANAKLTFWDIEREIMALENPAAKLGQSKHPCFTISDHAESGYGLDWHPTKTATFATGGCDAKIGIFQPCDGGQWTRSHWIETHSASVENVAWQNARSGNSLLASCSVDRSLQFFDARTACDQPAIKIPDAHTNDINVIAWRFDLEHQILSGGDDCLLKIWDVRAFEQEMCFQWHSKAISCVDWNPCTPDNFAAASLDDSVTLWGVDIIAELKNNLPSQLLFQHMGLHHIAQLRWHPQCTDVLMITAEDGIDVIRIKSS